MNIYLHLSKVHIRNSVYSTGIGLKLHLSNKIRMNKNN